MTGYVTVSIDDGTRQDLQTAALLAQHGLRATFYVPAQGPLELSRAELETLDKSFELGSHSFSHVDLTTLPADGVAREIREGKAWLQEIIGHEVTAFAYPFGRFNRRIASAVKEEGFTCARTCLLNRNDFPRDPYRLGMTTDAYFHSRRAQLRHGLSQGNLQGLRNFLVAYRLECDWETHFRRALEIVARDGGIAHLVIHSEVTDRQGDWNKLDRVLAAAAATGLKPVTNTEAASARR